MGSDLTLDDQTRLFVNWIRHAILKGWLYKFFKREHSENGVRHFERLRRKSI